MEQLIKWWRSRNETASGDQSVIDCTDQNQVASVTDHYHEARVKFCFEMLDRASDSPDPSTRI